MREYAAQVLANTSIIPQCTDPLTTIMRQTAAHEVSGLRRKGAKVALGETVGRSRGAQLCLAPPPAVRPSPMPQIGHGIYSLYTQTDILPSDKATQLEECRADLTSLQVGRQGACWGPVAIVAAARSKQRTLPCHRAHACD